jgi:hypothetical protein
MKQALLIATILLLTANIVSPAGPGLISYQGRFSDTGTPLADGAYSVAFTIYDQPTAGTVLWTETQNVTVTGGLFSVLLGSVNPISPSVFSGSTCFLGIKLGANPEMTPRPRLSSVPYSMVADSARTVGDGFVKLEGDTMSGELSMNFPFVGVTATLGKVGPYDGLLELKHNGSTRIGLECRDNGGFLEIKDSLGNARAQLSNVDGNGQFRLYGKTGTMMILDASGAGNVMLPQGSIDAFDIADEPGIASITSTATATLTSTTADILTVTIDIPTDGYIYLTAKGTAYLSGTTGRNYGYAQIDETAGGTITAPNYIVFGGEAMWTTSATYWPIFVSRVYSKSSAGTYTFRLEGRTASSQGSGAVVEIHNPTLQAIYVPTGY